MFTFAVGRHYRCMVEIPEKPRVPALAIMTVNWAQVPDRKLTTSEQLDYLCGLAAALREVAALIGVYPMLVEPPIH